MSDNRERHCKRSHKQTVDISLVAGPADASQSILKNNQSSLKGDFTDSAELHLVLHDISGNPIKVS